MHRSKLMKKLTLSAFLLLSANSQAEIVKYNFAAKGYSLTWGPGCTGRYCEPPPESSYGDHHLATMLNETSTLTGSFFYDTNLKKTYGDGSKYASYVDVNAIGSSFTTDTGFHYASSPGDFYHKPTIDVHNEPVSSRWGPDYVTMSSMQTDSYGGTELLTLDFTSKVGNGLLSNADLPTSLSLDNFKGEVRLFWTDGVPYQIFYANITSLSLAPAAPVPEPATYAMFGIGLACLGLAKRRQQRRQAA
ncbi:PEP-CTERM sorting domain-containing protein [Rugamonas sp. DEMB1]|uniref:PEP-CTERM sorting domain-containing protein n=1 Tax=Rugamonas sp. DEMB1 TaxID=3039386 RepID=UPI00244B01B8|nr:PEP-CTERM sorting domain-containing protein [Rugamonas sp. DEMB1]WGG52324.1 PEP-CTERM sorting domain-containing protein [Rugamonas sp. DEMB1]